VNKNILITGGKGFIGGHLVTLFPFAEIYDLKNNQNILDYRKLLKSVKGKGIVIHLAALTSVEDSRKKPGEYYCNNIVGTYNVIKAGVEMGCQTIIFASSAAVYTPDNPYGLSKKIGEDLMFEYRHKIQAISLRLFNIYGDGQNPEYAGVIDKYFQAAKEKKPLKITGDGKQNRDFIAVSDITQIMKRITEEGSKIKSGSVFEVGTGRSTTINELANIFAKRYKLPMKHLQDQPIGIFNSRAKNKSLLKIIGDYKFKSLKNGLKELEENF